MKAKLIKKVAATFALCAITFAVVFALHYYKGLLWLENKVDDFRVKNRAREDIPIRKDIVLVGIDDEALSVIGRWPWNRAIFGEFLRYIKRGSPKAVLFDIEFIERMQRNSYVDRLSLFPEIEVWYEGLTAEQKSGFNMSPESSETALNVLYEDYLSSVSNPRPFANANLCDDDYFAQGLASIGCGYLGLPFSDQITEYVNTMYSTGANFQDVLKKLKPSSRQEAFLDLIIYSVISRKFEATVAEVARLTKIKEEYIKGKLVDLRRLYVQNIVDESILEGISKGSVEVDLAAVRNATLKKLGITSEIDLIRRDVLLHIDGIVALRKELFENIAFVNSREAVELPEKLREFFRDDKRGMNAEFPVRELTRSCKSVGATNCRPDEDGVYRRHPFFFENRGEFIPQIAVKVAEQVMNLNFSKAYFDSEKMLRVPIGNDDFRKRIGPELVIPVTEDKTVLFNWASKYEDSNGFKHMPFYSGFYSNMQIEKLTYSNIIDVFKFIDRRREIIGFLKLYDDIRKNGLSAANMEKLREYLAIANGDVDDILKGALNTYDTRALKPESLERLKYKTNQLVQARNNFRSFEKYVIGPDNNVDSLKDKILIIGMGARASTDAKPTPFEPDTPMFFGHANILNAFFQNKFIRHANEPHNNTIMALSGVLSFGILSLLHPGGAFFLTLLVLVAYFYFTMFVFVKSGVFLVVVPVAAIMLIDFMVVTLFFYFYEEREKQFIRHAFSHYLSANVMEEVLDDPDNLKLKGEKRYLTVLFSDIRSFTTFSENHTPEEVVMMLNEYLNYMTEIVFKYKGTLDKYVGDELMAVYGAPSKTIQTDHAARALYTCFEMMDVLHDLQKKWVAEGSQAIDIGIGFNTGDMIIGNMGSNKHFDYTVIGDSVNLGARVEAATRQYNNHIIFTEFSLEEIKDLCEYKYLDNIKVKGKNKPVSIYEPLSLTPKGIEEMKKFGPRLQIEQNKKW